MGVEGKYSLLLPEIEEKCVSLNQPFQIKYSLLNEKDISEEIYDATVTDIIIKGVEKGAYIYLNDDRLILPEPLKNLKLSLVNYPDSEDLYGKVISIDSENKRFKLYFTHLPLATENIIIKMKQGHA